MEFKMTLVPPPTAPRWRTVDFEYDDGVLTQTDATGQHAVVVSPGEAMVRVNVAHQVMAESGYRWA